MVRGLAWAFQLEDAERVAHSISDPQQQAEAIAEVAWVFELTTNPDWCR